MLLPRLGHDENGIGDLFECTHDLLLQTGCHTTQRSEASRTTTQRRCSQEEDSARNHRRDDGHDHQ